MFQGVKSWKTSNNNNNYYYYYVNVSVPHTDHESKETHTHTLKGKRLKTPAYEMSYNYEPLIFFLTKQNKNLI